MFFEGWADKQSSDTALHKSTHPFRVGVAAKYEISEENNNQALCLHIKDVGTDEKEDGDNGQGSGHRARGKEKPDC